MSHQEHLLRRAYEAFNARDIDGALALMHPDLDWPNGMEGGRELGQDAVRAYWTRQFEVIDSHVEPLGFERVEDGRIEVEVHQVVRDLEGTVLSDGRVRHVYTFRDGLVSHMEIQEAEHAAPGRKSQRTSLNQPQGGLTPSRLLEGWGHRGGATPSWSGFRAPGMPRKR